MFGFNKYGIAQESHFSKMNVIKLSPVELGKSKYKLSYERYFGERKSSIVVSPAILLKEGGQESKSGLELSGEYRFYLTHIRKDRKKTFLGLYNIGFYTGLYGLYQDYEEDYVAGYYNPENDQYTMSTFNKTSSSFEGGTMVGVQIDITQRILFDFFVGGGIRKSDYTDSYDGADDYYNNNFDVFDPAFTGVKPKIGFMIGITF